MSKIKIILIGLTLILGLGGVCVSAQTTRGVGVRVKDADGQTKEVRLYEGSYALVIGESNYTAGWKSLPGVRDDLRAVSAALKAQGFSVTELLNPTRAQMTSGIDDFINNHGYDGNNRLLIYYAGHGHTQKSADGRELGYIVPSDAPLPDKNERLFRQIALNMNEIENYARRIEAKHALFVFDSCFSGSLLTKRRNTVPPFITMKTTQPVRQFITAGSDDQEVPDKSIFRQQFIEGVAGEADSNHDGYVTGSELAEFLQEKVTNYTRGSQTPQYGKIFDPLLDKGDFVFIPAKNAASVNSDKNRLSPLNSGIDPIAVERDFWEAIKNSTDAEDFKLYKEKYPNGNYAALAELKIRQLTRSTGQSNNPQPSTPIKDTGVSTDPAAEAERLYESGLAYHLKQQNDLAIIDFTKAIGLNPKYTFAYYNRGNAYRMNQQYDLAIADYSKVIELFPKYSFAYIYRAISYDAVGRGDLAAADRRKAEELKGK